MNIESIKTMLRSWQPFVSTLVIVFAGFVGTHPQYFQGWMVDAAIYLAGAGILGVGATVKQHNVTGGTVPIPSNEAAKASVLEPTSTKEGVQK